MDAKTLANGRKPPFWAATLRDGTQTRELGHYLREGAYITRQGASIHREGAYVDGEGLSIPRRGAYITRRGVSIHREGASITRGAHPFVARAHP